jgi:hypothetical protein
LVRLGWAALCRADLGSLSTREEQAVAAESVLAALWRRREAREPILIVIVNSRSDLAVLSEILLVRPVTALALASEFRQGDAIMAGKLVASPTLARIGLRWSVEGGSDVSAGWAALR